VNRLFFLEVGLDLRRRGAFLANAREERFQVNRGKRFGLEKRSEKQESKNKTGRDGSPSRPSNKSARSESPPYLYEVIHMSLLNIFWLLDARAQRFFAPGLRFSRRGCG
jgi:hypothetical protein